MNEITFIFDERAFVCCKRNKYINKRKKIPVCLFFWEFILLIFLLLLLVPVPDCLRLSPTLSYCSPYLIDIIFTSLLFISLTEFFLIKSSFLLFILLFSSSTSVTSSFNFSLLLFFLYLFPLLPFHYHYL